MAAELAVAEINTAGGVLGRLLAIDNRNPSWEEAKARSLAYELADAGVGLILGPTASKLSLAAAPASGDTKTVMISGWSTTPLLTAAADGDYFFRTIPSDALQGRVVAKRAIEQSRRRAAVLYAPHAYGEGLSAVFKQAFEAQGGQVVFQEAYGEATETDYQALMARALAAGPDHFVLIAYAVEGAKIVKAYLSGFSTHGVPWYFTDGCAETEFIQLVGADALTALQHEGTFPTVAESATRGAFYAAYRARYGKDPVAGSTGGIQIYDAVYLAALSMEAARDTKGTAIRDALRSVASPPGEAFTPAKYAQAVAALKAGRDIDFLGASGPVDFDAAGDVIGPYAIWKVQNGVLTTQGDPVSP